MTKKRAASPFQEQYKDTPATVEALSKTLVGMKGVVNLQRKRIEALEQKDLDKDKAVNDLTVMCNEHVRVSREIFYLCKKLEVDYQHTNSRLERHVKQRLHIAEGDE